MTDLSYTQDAQAVALVDEASGYAAAVDSSGAVKVAGAVTSTPSASVVSTLNSYYAPVPSAVLGIGGVFTGTGEEVKDYSAITIYAYSDVASATNGVSIQFSAFSATGPWTHQQNATLTANGVGEKYSFEPLTRWFRIVYTNGAVAQTVFNLQTIFHSVAIIPPQTSMQALVDPDATATMTRSVIVGEKSGGGGPDFVNVKVNPSGALTADVTQATSPWVVSGTVTANIGTQGGVALDATLVAVEGTVAPGTAATKSLLMGAVYNSTKPTLTNAQQAALQLDADGSLRVVSDRTMFATDTFTFTSATPAQARPVSGDMAVGETSRKTVIVKNTGANSARITIYASVDGGTNYDTFLANSTLLATGNTLEVNSANAYTHIRVFAASATGGQSNTVVSRGYSSGT